VPDLKLRRLPDRNPVKLTLMLPPDLSKALDDYRLIYNQHYEADEPVAELAVHMLTAFLAGDRTFTKAREALNQSGRRDA
jgi:hypothetical protein